MSAKVREARAAKQFFVARLARLYPLHLVTLLTVAGTRTFSRTRLDTFRLRH
jgi:peptidoglycan/LPS O-acetylase OafA/YrhL